MHEQKCRRIVADRSGGRCEMCPSHADHVHHRKNRSQGGQWTPANCLHLCVFCHHHVTVNPARARDHGGWAVRSRADPTTTPVWLYRDGWALLTDTGTIETLEEKPWSPDGSPT